MIKTSPQTLLPVVLAYLPVPIVGAALSAYWDVGASPEGGASDMWLRGTALTPPLFLPALLVIGAAAARADGRGRRIGSSIAAIVGLAFLGGSTANLPNDFAAAEAAGTPLALTAGLAAVHLALALALIANAGPTAIGRGVVRSSEDEATA
jgi:hypothetical protein